VSFPDFPGCVTAGKTLEEARRLAVEALEMHIAGMIEDGEELPEPAALDDLTQIEQIDRRAKEAGMTRSAFMVQSALHATGKIRRPA